MQLVLDRLSPVTPVTRTVVANLSQGVPLAYRLAKLNERDRIFQTLLARSEISSEAQHLLDSRELIPRERHLMSQLPVTQQRSSAARPQGWSVAAEEERCAALPAATSP
jgi:hypothetical protein